MSVEAEGGDRPLLIEGPAGGGKTDLARALETARAAEGGGVLYEWGAPRSGEEGQG